MRSNEGVDPGALRGFAQDDAALSAATVGALDALADLGTQFLEIQCPRPSYVLERHVVGAHDTEEQRWAQCVLELQLKYDAVVDGLIERRVLIEEARTLEGTGDAIDALRAMQKRYGVVKTNRALLGAIREIHSLLAIYQRFGRTFTRQELDASQEELFRRRLLVQAEADMISRQTGISPGNVMALRLAGVPLPPVLPSYEPPVAASLGETVAQVEQRFLGVGHPKVLVVTPTEKKPESDALLPVQQATVEGWPGEAERHYHCIYGMPVDQALNQAVLTALDHAMKVGTTHLLIIEDDTFPPPDGVERLLKHGLDIVGGWYPWRKPGPRKGTPIVLTPDGERATLDDPDGTLREVYTIPTGFTLFRIEVFRRIPYPWFVTGVQLTQDSFFSQQAREAGFRLWCDTAVRCRHVDRDTGEAYE
jgi:hypothetical protein